MITLCKYLLLFAVSCVVSGTPQNRQYVYYPRFFRSLENVPYLPPTNEENEAKQPYLPPQADSFLNYIPPGQIAQENPNNYYFVPGPVEELPVDFDQGVRVQTTGPQGQATGEARGQFVNVQTETQQFPAEQYCDCSQRQVAGGSDIEVDLPRGEPEGYDYPKPIKRLELPGGLKPLVRTLDQELPNEDSPTTTEIISEANETESTTNQIPNEIADPNRLTRSSLLLSEKVQTKPESGPVYIKTLPFQLEPRISNYMSSMENHQEAKRAAQYYQGDPTKWLQISQPKPSGPQTYQQSGRQVRPVTRPYQQQRPQIQISPPAPAGYRQQGQGQPQIQISPPAPTGYKPRY